MSTRKEIERLIEKKEQERAEHLRQAEHAGVYIQALKDTLKRIPVDPLDVTAPKVKLRAGSDLEKVQNVIRKAGKPIHINLIIASMGEAGKAFVGPKFNGLVGSLTGYAKKGRVFTRPEPNTFGLVEFIHNSIEAKVETNKETTEEQPPFRVVINPG